MGLIKEPQDVDFYVIDKAWSEVELKEFSELIKLHKTQQQKRKIKPVKSEMHEELVKV